MIRSINKGREIHVDIVRRGLLEIDTICGSALLQMYFECDLFGEAQETLFLEEKNKK